MSASQDLKVNWKNVPTRTITAGGVEFAYRALGTNNPGTPVSEFHSTCRDRPRWHVLPIDLQVLRSTHVPLLSR